MTKEEMVKENDRNEQSGSIEVSMTAVTAPRPQHGGLFAKVSISEWELLDERLGRHSVARFRIEGGYLYRTIVKDVGVAMVFVPDGTKIGASGE